MDLVALHIHMTRNRATAASRGSIFFRLENGKIVEHWDLIQEVPEKAANLTRCSRAPGSPLFSIGRSP